MSINRGMGEGPSDKEKKLLLSMFDKKQREKKMAPYSPVPTGTIIDPGKGQLDDEAENMKKALDATKESGSSSERVGKEEIETQETGDTTAPTFAGKVPLFQVWLNPRDLKEGRLSIPVEITLDHDFPRPPKLNRRAWEEKITISDTQDHVWPMTVKYLPEQCMFLINSEWQKFIELHDVKAKDMIFFYPYPGPPHGSKNRHYLIDVERYQEPSEILFPEDGFMFQWEVTPDNVIFGSISFDKEIVKRHFPSVRIPAETHRLERLYFTDNRKRDWCMKVTCELSETYVLDWEGFAKEYKVKAGDLLRFYKPDQPLTPWHFLILRLFKHEPGMSNLTQPSPSQYEAKRDEPAGKKKFGSGWFCMAGKKKRSNSNS